MDPPVVRRRKPENHAAKRTRSPWPHPRTKAVLAYSALSQFDEETTRRVAGRRNRRPKPISALSRRTSPEVGRSRAIIQHTALRFSRVPHPRASPHATRVIAISSRYRRPAAERATHALLCVRLTHPSRPTAETALCAVATRKPLASPLPPHSVRPVAAGAWISFLF